MEGHQLWYSIDQGSHRALSPLLYVTFGRVLNHSLKTRGLRLKIWRMTECLGKGYENSVRSTQRALYVLRVKQRVALIRNYSHEHKSS